MGEKIYNEKLSKSKYITFLFFIFLAALVIILYYSNLTAFFVSDDFNWITNSKDRNPITFFITNSDGGIGGENYGPIINLIYYISYKINGLSPLPYHLFSILFHFSNIVLIYFVSKLFFNKKTSLLAALLFTVYFNNSEAVAWIAAIPHLSATLFYLLAILLWFKFFRGKKKIFFIGSLLSFFIALLSKEIALSLPFVLIILYLFEIKRNRKKFHITDLYGFTFYFLVLAFYLYLRYYTTDVVFGYYGRGDFNFEWIYYIKNGISYLITIFFSGDFRVQMKELALNNLWQSISFIIAIVILLGALFKKHLKSFILIGLFTFVLIIVYLPLVMSPFNNEGERYLYLPSIAFCIILAFLLTNLSKKLPYLTVSIIIITTITSSYILFQKNKVWVLGSEISKNIINDFPKRVDINKSNERTVFLYLPDNIEGTQIFRNAIKEAIKLYYPNYDLDAIALPVYLILQKDNWSNNLISWSTIEYGIVGKTTNLKKIITGLDRRENEYLIFELWGYDYEYFITDTIFLEIKKEFAESMKNKQTNFLYFNEGGLMLLDESLIKNITTFLK